MNKIVLVDYGYLMFAALFGTYGRGERGKELINNSVYLVQLMLIGNLTRVGIDKSDTVIIAVDSYKGSWRKDLDKAYKANRKAQREEKEINWKETYEAFNNLLLRLESYTPFHVIQADKLEADDLISVSCRLFIEKEIIIVSIDEDYEQLYAYPNVKIFSPRSKKYKIINNPYAILASKIEREASDNLITPLITQQDRDLRKKLVSLLELPEEIEKVAIEKLSFLPEKDWDYDKLTFSKTLASAYKNIYRTDKIVLTEKENTKKQKIKKKILGQELILDLNGCNQEYLQSKEKLTEYIVKISELIGADKTLTEPIINDAYIHQQLSDGSINGHLKASWNRASFNIFTNSEFNIKNITSFTKKFFEAKKIKKNLIVR